MLLVCSSAASCIRLVSWLRYLWFSCRRRGAASLEAHSETIKSLGIFNMFSLLLRVCVEMGEVGFRTSPVVWSGQGCKGVWGADRLRWLGPLGHLQQVGWLGTGCYRVPGWVLSLKKRERGRNEEVEQLICQFMGNLLTYSTKVLSQHTKLNYRFSIFFPNWFINNLLKKKWCNYFGTNKRTIFNILSCLLFFSTFY